jgi:hypothetical protein
MKKDSQTKLPNGLFWSIVILIALGSIAAVIGNGANRAPSTSITIANNSSLEIRHVYLSAPDSDNWSADQLHDSSIAPGQSSTLDSVSCDQTNIRVIAEDQNGCFLSRIVACGENTTWTITNATSRDCGN